MNGILNGEDLLQARRMLAAMVDLGDTAHDDEGATRRRIDILERMIEVLRYELEYPDNKLPFERFVNGEILVDGGVMHYRPGQRAPFESVRPCAPRKMSGSPPGRSRSSSLIRPCRTSSGT